MPTPGDRRAIAYSAAAMYAGAMVVVFLEAALPGGEDFSMLPGVIALVLAPLVGSLGARVPYAALAALGPFSACGIAYAVATTEGYADGAVLYVWPVLWMSYFYGVRGAVLIVLWIGLVHGAVLATMPPERANVDRWIDVMVSIVVVAGVIRGLAAGNARLLDRLATEARVDSLTGLLNRRGFDERMGMEVVRAQRDGYPLAIVAFDVDHFKGINDDHGHDVGDNVLASLGSLIGEGMRGVDVAGRIGGDELVVALPRADEDAAHTFAERIRGAVAALDGPALGIGDGLSFTVSAGLVSSAPPLDGAALLVAADEALYAAKRAGRDRIVHAGAPAGGIAIST